MWPTPGSATVADVIAAEQADNRLCELVDGTLVEKPTGYEESVLAAWLVFIIQSFVEPRDLGVVTGPDGMVQLFPNLVRIPDVAFAGWTRVRALSMPRDAAPLLAPDLAVEVLSPTNAIREMKRKRGEYFSAGVRLVWIVDPVNRTVAVYESDDDPISILKETDALDGRDVLPGFSYPVRDLFLRLDKLKRK
jgi:Uma2 family endonuclease